MNRKFKLIKEYPNSPILGTIIEFNNNDFIQYYGSYYFINNLITYKEFWEEITKTFPIKDSMGYIIDKGDSYFFISKNLQTNGYIERAIIIPDEMWIIFKNKKDRDYFIIMNKPCLSLNDVAEVYITANNYNPNRPDLSLGQPKKLYELAKSKLRL